MTALDRAPIPSEWTARVFNTIRHLAARGTPATEIVVSPEWHDRYGKPARIFGLPISLSDDMGEDGYAVMSE